MSASSRSRVWLHPDLLATLILLVFAFLIAMANLRDTGIDNLDSAHHLMDSFFFRDLLVDHPLGHLPGYALSYYKQYPALGFLFWPPLVPFVFGFFCLFGGTHVLTVRVAIFFFGALFAACFYLLLRRRLSPLLAFCAAAAMLALPGMSWSLNEIMLELPTLAFMGLALLAYLGMVDHADTQGGMRRALLFAVAAAAVIYAKQPAWFLYPAILTDAIVLHRELFRRRETWIAVAVLSILCLPLALFTLKFGHANLQQSLGSNTQLIMSGYHELSRWSLGSWLFYPRMAGTYLNGVVLLLTGTALVLAVLRPAFGRDHLLWLAWFCFAYLTFSYYDNKSWRHATFWWPSWVALAAGALGYAVAALERRPSTHRLAQGLPVLLLVPILWQLPPIYHQRFTEYHAERPLIAPLFDRPAQPTGNILLLGEDKQTFVELIREYDGSRQTHVIRGNGLIEDGLSIAMICRKFQVRTVIIENSPIKTASEAASYAAIVAPLTATSSFTALPQGEFLLKGKPVPVLRFHYLGPIDSHMGDVSLSTKLL